MQPLRSILYYEGDDNYLSDTVFSLEEKGGFDVFSFSNYEKSLSELGKINPDLILLNAELADISAVELLHKLKKQDQFLSVPAVLYTKKEIDDDFVENNDVGIVAMFKKPMRGADLINSLHELWGKLRNEKYRI